MPYPCCGPHCSVCRMSMSSVPCSSSIRFLYWSFSLIDVDTLLPLEVDRLLRFVQCSDQPCPLSRFKVRQFSGRELVILHWRSIAESLTNDESVTLSLLPGAVFPPIENPPQR